MVQDSEKITDLAERAAAGDVDAQALLCREYEREVRIAARVFLSKQLRPHLDSGDVAQSVHKSILARLVQGKLVVYDSRRLVALACLIAKRKIAKKWRKHRRQERLPEAAYQFIPELADSQLGQAEEDGFLHKLASIRESVSLGERQLIDLRLSGLSNDEIAQRLNIEPVALRVRWSRLCAKIRKNHPLGDESTSSP